MGSSCKDQRNQVAICLQRSPCVLIDRHTPKECITDDKLRQELPEQCRFHLMAFMECKRGMVDMRKRFRGNGRMSTGKYDEKLAQLSSGNYDPAEEQRLLAGAIPKKE
ncbi:mitochondrial protein Pet191p [Trichomonascus vanleenenianus]|uniref:Pet191p n=1 Tax=Trichomonascus vanleenenianus TaxID=2268995 RepID=UPI003EC9AE6E